MKAVARDLLDSAGETVEMKQEGGIHQDMRDPVSSHGSREAFTSLCELIRSQPDGLAVAVGLEALVTVTQHASTGREFVALQKFDSLTIHRLGIGLVLERTWHQQSEPEQE